MSGQIKRSNKYSFTAIPNEPLRRNDLSWKAKGLLCYLLSLSDGWCVYKKDLQNRSKDGYDSMISGWIELEESGYIETVEVRDKGLFNGYEYIIHESPIREKPESDKPESVFPDLINTSNKKINKGSTKSLEEREKEFYNELAKLIKNKCNQKGYDKETIRDFYDYWREPNKSKTQMKFEKESTWDLQLRLGRWKSIGKSNNNSNKTKEATASDIYG